MADSELTDLTAATTLTDADVFYVVVDPAGTPLDRKITKSNLAAALALGAAPVLASGLYSSWGGLSSPGVSSAIPASTNVFLRFPVSRACTLDRIGLEITTLGAASVVRLGIYAETNGKPAALILDAGTIDATGTGLKEITISQAITAGVVWLCAAAQGSSTVAWRCADAGDLGGSVSNSTTNASQQGRSVFVEGSVSGALPSSATPTTNGSLYRPRIFVRVV
jgi:hypothetical protein